MPEDQITDYIPFDGNFYRFVRTLHGLKAVADVLVDDAHNWAHPINQGENSLIL